jgi:hypothetical protein
MRDEENNREGERGITLSGVNAKSDLPSRFPIGTRVKVRDDYWYAPYRGAIGTYLGAGEFRTSLVILGAKVLSFRDEGIGPL